jgi:hypothetical protein
MTAPIVQSVSPHLNALTAPAPLRHLTSWLVWRFEHLAGEKKPRKVPYYANGVRRFGVQGSAKDRAQMVTFDAAIRAAVRGGYSGVGIALLDGDNVTALDFDNCVTASGIDPSITQALAGTYSEFSPSGTGIRAFVQGNLGNRKTPTTDTYGFETFSTKGFVTVTGNRTEDCDLFNCENTIAPPSPDILTIIERRFKHRDDGEFSGTINPKGLTEEQVNECLAAIPSDISHDEWLHVGMALHHETGGDGFEFWNTWSATASNYPGSETLEERWHSFGQSQARPITANFLLDKAKEYGAETYLAFCTAAPTDFDIVEAPPLPVNGHYRIRTAAEFVRHIRPTSWLIKGVLPRAELGVIYGESASGKTFIAWDMCAALARGVDWNGFKVNHAKVLYVVAEGSNGFNNRIQAYCHQYAIPHNELNIDVISDVIPNLGDQGSVNRLCEDVKRFGPYDLIIMDTFAQVTAGSNENSGEDMGKALLNARRIGKAAGAMVLLIHHSGKDSSKGARGHSSIRAACDFEAEVTRFENDRAFQVTKLKDGRDGAQFGFKLLDVVLGEDEDGDDITSCIVEFGTSKSRLKRLTGPKGDIEKLVLSVAHELAGFGDENDSGFNQQDLLEQCVLQVPYDDTKRDQRRARVIRAVESLLSRDLLVLYEGRVKLARKE